MVCCVAGDLASAYRLLQDNCGSMLVCFTAQVHVPRCMHAVDAKTCTSTLTLHRERNPVGWLLLLTLKSLEQQLLNLEIGRDGGVWGLQVVLQQEARQNDQQVYSTSASGLTKVYCIIFEGHRSF